MAKGDRLLMPFLNEMHVKACFRYVDDFLLCLPYKRSDSVNVEKILQEFTQLFPGLEFTFEMPTESSLKFLDLQIFLIVIIHVGCT